MHTSTSIHLHTPTQHQQSNQWTMYERKCHFATVRIDVMEKSNFPRRSSFLLPRPPTNRTLEKYNDTLPLLTLARQSTDNRRSSRKGSNPVLRS